MHPRFQTALMLVFIAAFVSARAQAVPSPPSTPEVILLGTVHDMHLREDLRYSLIDLRREIEALKPDAVCGEITPEAYRKPMESNFPIEAAYISEIAPDLHIQFVPSDWRVAYEWQRRAGKLIPKDIKERASAIDRQQGEEAMGYKGPSLFDYVHSDRFLGLSDEKFHEINGEDTPADIAYGAWHERNRKIVENCLAGTEGAKRVVLMFGANHLAQLRRELTTQNVRFSLAPRLFTPSGLGKVPGAVLARWKKNLDGMKGINDGTIPASKNDRDTVRSNVRRLKELENIINVYSAR